LKWQFSQNSPPRKSLNYQGVVLGLKLETFVIFEGEKDFFIFGLLIGVRVF
jgi:hypothetical protein